MQIEMIVTDIDGTLIPMGKTAPPRVLQALSRVMEKGILVVPATGRTKGGLPKELAGLSGFRYLISSNGAVITDLKKNHRILEELISPRDAADLLRELAQYQVYTCVYIQDEPYNWTKLPEFLGEYYQNLQFFQKNAKEDLAEFIETQELKVEKIFVAISSQEDREEIRRKFVDRPTITVTSSSSWNLEFNHVRADKGKAMRFLCDFLGIARENTIAMGDGENDHSMLKEAGLAISLENAEAQTKAIADKIISACQEEGVATFLEETFLDDGK